MAAHKLLLISKFSESRLKSIGRDVAEAVLEGSEFYQEHINSWFYMHAVMDSVFGKN